MIYINGDSHSAGAELVKDYCFAQDDPRYIAWGRRAHPEAIPLTYGYKIAQALNMRPLEEVEAEKQEALDNETALSDRFGIWLGFEKFTAQVSLRDPLNKEKYIGTDQVWNTAEKAIINATKEKI